MKTRTEHILSRLPELLAEIADVAGIPAALQLASIYGGQRVFIPTSIEENHWLAQCVGLDAAKAICGHLSTPGLEGDFRGDGFLIPMASNLAHLAPAYGREASGTLSAAEISRREKVHVRTVYRRRAKRRALDALPD